MKKRTQTDRQLSVAHLMLRYDVSRMCIYRWRRDPDVKFPPPDMTVKDRDYWLEEKTIIPWERATTANRGEKRVPPRPNRRAAEKGGADQDSAG
jgi:hypothetical protein